jgi:hypothetical protein
LVEQKVASKVEMLAADSAGYLVDWKVALMVWKLVADLVDLYRIENFILLIDRNLNLKNELFIASKIIDRAVDFSKSRCHSDFISQLFTSHFRHHC